MAARHMNLVQPFDDDSEPFDPDERCDAAFGPYHIGLCDPNRSEIALVFDTRWMPSYGCTAKIDNRITDALEGHEAVIARRGWYAAPGQTVDQMHAALVAELVAQRAFVFPEDNALYVVIVELPTSRVRHAARALANFHPYIGHANVSWPSELRSILQTALTAA